MYTHNNPISHRKHKKSVTGCKACKQRKVKCDEKRPICGKCEVHFSNLKACEYGPPPKAASKKSASSALGTYQPKDVKPICPRPKDVPHTPLDIAKEVATIYSGLQAGVPVGLDTLTPPPEKVASKTISLGRSCGCPCHKPEYTQMMLDSVFGVCRICGNMPSLNVSPSICLPVVPETVLMSGRIDPFGVLPSKQSPRVHALIYHSMANPALFNATLFVSSTHLEGLHGRRESSESLFYKLETIRVLNDVIKDPELAVADETIAAVLLLGNIISIIGEPGEVDAHLNGLQKMVNLRGGIESFTINGVFLHMLCTTNHLSAVLSESKTLVPPTGIPYQPRSSTSSPSSSSTTNTSSTSPSIFENSLLFKPFAVECGFNSTLVDMFHDIGYLYAIVDAFTRRLLPSFRKGFEDIVKQIEDGENGCAIEAKGPPTLKPRHGLA